jgi:hypothetical protein
MTKKLRQERRNSNKAAASTSLKRSDLRVLKVLLQAVFAHAFANQTREAAIREIVNNAIKGALDDQARNRTTRRALEHASELLHIWHSDERYLDNLAQPKPLPMTGQHSIAEIAARLEPDVPTPLILKQLRLGKLIRPARASKYLPVSSMVRITSAGVQRDAYLGQSLLHFASTLQSNLRSGATAQKLIERSAIVRDIPCALLEEYRQFSADQGSTFVSNVNDWLESRRAGRVGGRRQRLATAGVNVFAFVSPND